jgi:nickel-dependent lactate racemase
MDSNSVELRSGAWFGDEPLTLTFPKDWEVTVVAPPDDPALDADAIKARIAQPIGAPRLAEVASQRSRAAILVDDLTRPTPVAALLPPLLEELAAGGIGADAVTVVVAGGTHPRMSADDVKRKLGERLSRELRVLVHDCREDLVDLGVSERGTPLFADKHVMECDLKIGVGGIYPHRAAGFSGGPKIAMPGIVGLRTAQHIHATYQTSKRRGGDTDTEFRKELADFADRIGLDFLVNVLVNPRREITAVFAGHRLQAFEAGVKYAREHYAVAPASDSDIIIADAYPFDLTMHAALARRVFWPAQGKGTSMSRIGIAACPLGIGTHEIFSHEQSPLVRFARRGRDTLQAILTPSGRKKARRRKELSLLMLSPGLTPKQLSRVRPGYRHFASWSQLLDVLKERYNGVPPRVVVYRCSGLMLP